MKNYRENKLYKVFKGVFLQYKTSCKKSLFSSSLTTSLEIHIILQVIKLYAEQVHSQLIVFLSQVPSSCMINHGEQSHQTTILRLETEACHPDSSFKAINRTIHHKTAIRRLNQTAHRGCVMMPVSALTSYLQDFKIKTAILKTG